MRIFKKTRVITYLFFCSHVTRTASWLPPAENWPMSREGSGSSQAEDDEELPFGWEQALDNHGKPYYIK
jgi:FERM and PDZ domain-containing protein 4